MAIDTGFGKVKLFDDFLGPVMDETNNWTTARDGSGLEAITLQVDGAVLITADTSSGNRTSVTQSLNWQASDGGPLIGEFRVKSISAVTDRAIFVGFTNAASTSTLEIPIEMSSEALATNADNAVGFMYDTAATYDVWYCVGTASTVDATEVKTTVVPVADTYQTLRVVVNITGDAEFFIDGQFVGAVENAVTPGTDLTPIMVIENRSGSSTRAMNVDYVYLEKGRAAA